jgi:hypothetical protein
MHLEGWRFDRWLEHDYFHRAQFHAARRLFGRHYLAFNPQRRLRRHAGEAFHLRRIVQHHLRQAASVTDYQKRDAAQPSQAVQPTDHRHGLTDVRRQLDSPDTLHA